MLHLLPSSILYLGLSGNLTQPIRVTPIVSLLHRGQYLVVFGVVGFSTQLLRTLRADRLTRVESTSESFDGIHDASERRYSSLTCSISLLLSSKLLLKWPSMCSIHW
jgi:hypothetical protein